MILTWVKQWHMPPMGMASIPPIQMLMTGGWFMIVLPTLGKNMNHEHSELPKLFFSQTYRIVPELIRLLLSRWFELLSAHAGF